MKIEENQSAVLSNHEVLSFIKTKQAKWAEQGRTDTVPRNVTRVLKNVQSHLSRAGTALEPGPASAKYSPEAIRRLLERLMRDPWRLPLGELMAILNLRPASIAELDPIIEENEERFSTEEMEQILGIIAEVLGEKVREEGGEEEADGQDGERDS